MVFLFVFMLIITGLLGYLLFKPGNFFTWQGLEDTLLVFGFFDIP